VDEDIEVRVDKNLEVRVDNDIEVRVDKNLEVRGEKNHEVAIASTVAQACMPCYFSEAPRTSALVSTRTSPT
jgi:hypothetical protein